MREPRLRSSPSIFHPSTNRRMYRFASNGEMGEPCGMPRRLSRASVVRVFLPRSSVSSTAHSSHTLIRCSTRRSTIRRVTDFSSSAWEYSRSSPRGRRLRLPGGPGTAALPPRPPPAGRFARDGTHTVLVEGRLRRSVQHQHRCCHADPITQGRDAQRPKFAVGLRYEHSSDGSRSVSLLPESKRQFAKPPLHPVRGDIREVL